MRYVYIIRLLVVVAGLLFFYIAARRLSRERLRGHVLLGTGISLVALSMMIGFFYHGELFKGNPIREQLLPMVAPLTGMVGQTLGILLLVVGAWRLITSLQPHLSAHYASLVEQSFVGVFIIQDGILRFVNPRLAEMLDYEREDLTDKPAIKFIDSTQRSSISGKMAFLDTWESKPGRTELICLKKNGQKIELELIARVISYYGKPAIHGTIVDTTSRKQALEVILAGEERFRTLANSSHDIISESDPDGILMYLSENTKDILGYDHYNLINTSVFNLMHPDDIKTVAKELLLALRHNTSVRIIFRYRHKKGNWRWFEGSGRAYETGSGEKRVVVVSRDITSRKQKEAEVLKASKLESIGVLAGGIAHDFNNILTVILGNVSLARSYLSGPDSEPGRILSEAERACAQAQKLTNQLLTFSKGGAPVTNTASIAQLLYETSEFALHGSNIRCDIHFDDNLWLVKIDQDQMAQVVHNLIINASQAMPEGGAIQIYAENNHFTENNDLPLSAGDFVKIAFKDRGQGIQEENLTKIFDPYFTTKDKGSGLGLATAYSIVKNHNGFLTAESTVGLGTTFYVYLPADPNGRLPKPKREGQTLGDVLAHSEHKILLMDDEDTIRNSVGRMLKRLGYVVELAEDGDEAINLYRKAQEAEEPFDAVLIDLTIRGGMGGKETIENLLKIDPGVKAVVSSGYSHDPIMADYQNYGFSGVIAKPYKFDKLEEVLTQVILSNLD